VCVCLGACMHVFMCNCACVCVHASVFWHMRAHGHVSIFIHHTGVHVWCNTWIYECMMHYLHLHTCMYNTCTCMHVCIMHCMHVCMTHCMRACMMHFACMYVWCTTCTYVCMMHKLHVHVHMYDTCTCVYVWCDSCVCVCIVHYCACIYVSYLHACMYDALLCIHIPTVTRNLYKYKYMTLLQVLTNWQAGIHVATKRPCTYIHSNMPSNTRTCYIPTYTHTCMHTHLPKKTHLQ